VFKLARYRASSLALAQLFSSETICSLEVARPLDTCELDRPPVGRVGAEGEEMSDPKDAENTASKFDEKLHKLIKRAKKQHGLLWPAVVSKLELARADVKAMIKLYNSGPK